LRGSNPRFEFQRFRPEKVLGDRFTLIKVHHPDTQKLLGYIRFKHDEDDQGHLEVANFDAKLQIKDLSIGETSKAGDTSQAGQFREGLKMGALVLHRAGHTIRMVASSFRWRFSFNKKNDKLAVTLSRIQARKLQQEKQNFRADTDTPAARSWADVSVIIGGPGKVRNSNGSMVAGAKIFQSGFLGVVKCYHGHLPSFACTY
jgi:hypothetical protein